MSQRERAVAPDAWLRSGACGAAAPGPKTSRQLGSTATARARETQHSTAAGLPQYHKDISESDTVLLPTPVLQQQNHAARPSACLQYVQSLSAAMRQGQCSLLRQLLTSPLPHSDRQASATWPAGRTGHPPSSLRHHRGHQAALSINQM